MTDASQLSFEESIWLGLLVLQILGLYCWCWTQPRIRLAWFQPPVIVSVVFLYYTVIGPLIGLQNGEWIFLGEVNVREGYRIAWEGAAVSFASFLVGFGLLRQRLPQPKYTTSLDPLQAWRLGRKLNMIGIGLYSLSAGERVLVQINPFTARQVQVASGGLDLGPFAAYFGLALNLAIPGVLLMMAAWLKRRNNLPEFVIWLVVIAGIYTTIGFRWRLAVLASGMLILWYLATGRQPKLTVVIPTIIGMLYGAGLIVQNRIYGAGLNLSASEGMSFWDLVMASFQEASIFYVSAGVMDLIPNVIPYVGFTAIWEVLVSPIPRGLLQSKPKAEYVIEAVNIMLNRPNVNINSGQAMLNYAEYFLIGGWPVVIIGYLLIGWLCRLLWQWFLWRRQEPIAQVAYITAAVYLYMVISRGYLNQVVTLFCFTVLPIFIFYYRSAKPVLPDHIFSNHHR